MANKVRQDDIGKEIVRSNPIYAHRTEEYLRQLRHRLRKVKVGECAFNGCHVPAEGFFCLEHRRKQAEYQRDRYDKIKAKKIEKDMNDYKNNREATS